MKMSLIVIALAAAALLVGCKKDPTPTPAPVAPAAQEAVPAASEEHGDAAKPGSHEDWCGAHGVPESQCTRCNGELAAAFKATGDWCAEHGLPESQCVKCDPKRKAVRPPKAATP